MDDTVYSPVPGARHVPEVLQVGLHLQHGCEHHGGDPAERDVDIFLHHEVSPVEAHMGGVAGNCGCLGHYCDELGVVGLSADRGAFGCSCVVASRDGVSDCVVL